ncbi:hypothetical protein D9619_009660 [Psilocybe cf. subviscida]|uniref:Endonuclease/exonuclease/phosphatase domain-containing protein n=1 Tax=Psilocybe cf. subviscida TaxID=2480587 RepID=A0A8H5BLU8_9AGAR|nr:hypothetical protein D9619_009660 [Psilocybe cf. subviscida]
MCRDIIDHCNVLVLSLFAEGHTFNFMNVYSDNEFTVIRLLAARADTLPQFHYMGGDFNCHSSAWDPVPRPANVAASHWLLEAAATIGLELGTVSNPGPTHIPRDASKRPSNKAAIKTLNKMQHQAALWITGAFYTSPGGGIEALAGLMPLHMTLAKLSSGSVTCVVSLSDTHPVRSLMSGHHLKHATPHACSIELMTPALKAKVKGLLMQADTILPRAVENMDPFHALAQPGLRLLDCFCDHIMFDAPSRSPPPPPPPSGDGPSAEEILDVQMWANTLIRDKIHVPKKMAALAAMPVPKSAHIKPIGLKMLARAQQCLYLNAFLQELEGDTDTIHAVVDGSLPTAEQLQATAAVIIRQQTEQLHWNRFVAGRVTAHDTELYAIQSTVVQCTQHDAKQIVIFTDVIGSARVAVDPTPHSGQAHLLAVCAVLQGWLQGDEERTITFVDVPSSLRWSLHGQAHQYDTQLCVPLGRDPALTINSIRQTTDLWREHEWKTKFLHSPLPGAAFLWLQGVDGTQLQPSSKGGPWIKLAGSDNVLFARMCSQRQDREHILAYCHQYTRISIDAPVLGPSLVCFLKDNPSAFAFPKPDQGVG